MAAESQIDYKALYEAEVKKRKAAYYQMFQIGRDRIIIMFEQVMRYCCSERTLEKPLNLDDDFVVLLKQTLEVHAGFVAPLMRQGLYGDLYREWQMFVLNYIRKRQNLQGSETREENKKRRLMEMEDLFAIVPNLGILLD